LAREAAIGGYEAAVEAADRAAPRVEGAGAAGAAQIFAARGREHVTADLSHIDRELADHEIRAASIWLGDNGPTPTCTPRGYGCNLIYMKQPVISCSPEVMGGTAVFYGTRVPVQTLLDYLEAGDTIDEFLEGFPSVTREQVIAFLEEAKDRLIETVS
jgi:uncharacterized protein (DUF433 family)